MCRWEEDTGISLKPVRQQPGEIRGGEAEGSGQRPESHVVKTGKVAGRDSDGPAPSVLPWSHCTNSKRASTLPCKSQNKPLSSHWSEFLLGTTEQNSSLVHPLFIKICFNVDCDSTDCYILLGKQFSKILFSFFNFFLPRDLCSRNQSRGINLKCGWEKIIPNVL